MKGVFFKECIVLSKVVRRHYGELSNVNMFLSSTKIGGGKNFASCVCTLYQKALIKSDAWYINALRR